MPCNQFKGQEPGTAEEIAEFCSATYGVTFPMTEKLDVNGPERTRSSSGSRRLRTPRAPPATSSGTSRSGWSTPGATSSPGSGPTTQPDAPEVRAAIEAALAA